jgi:alpha-2-macroglobulin
MRVNGWRLGIVMLVVLALVAGACTSGDDDDDADQATPVTSADGPFQIRLSAGEAEATRIERIALATGTELESDRVADIADRLPALVADEDDQQPFRRPAETLPPPIVGTTVDTPFPGPDAEAAPEVPAGPLRVVRVQPEGDVDIAPFLSVTFDQPMVPVATLDQLDAADVPVVMEPELPGRWRWIGTRTLRFEHDPTAVDRLPMATEYRVEIPAGTTSATGGALAEAVTWTFRTPAPTVTSLTPLSRQMPRIPLLVATFDQRVDPARALGSITVRGGGSDRPIRLATDAEIEADEVASEAVRQATDGRWIAFRPVDELPIDTVIEIVADAGLASAEGPRTTDEPQRFEGRTYPQLAIEAADCGWGEGCRPGMPLVTRMTTDLDEAAFDPAAIRVEPAIPGMVVNVHGSEIVVGGMTDARTTYRVRLPADLLDVFGQRLGSPTTATFEVGDAVPTLTGPRRQLVTLDPFAPRPLFTVSSIGHDELRVRTFAVDVDDWGRFQTFVERGGGNDLSHLPDFPLLSDEVVSTDLDPNTFGPTRIDLAQALGDSDHTVVVVESTRTFPQSHEAHWSSRPVVVWVQRTTIGLDAIGDGHQVVVWSTDLTTGRPLGGTEIEVDGRRAAVRTDGDGLASVAVTGPRHVIARRDGESAILAGWELRYHDSTQRADQARWHVMDDRGLYRPGETARLKGWVRRLTTATDAQLRLLGDDVQVRWTAFDAFGTELAAGETPVSRVGGFDFEVAIPEGANLGQGTVQLELVGAPGLQMRQTGHPLQLAEFRRPEFEVVVEPTTAGPYLATSPATVALSADYFGGGPVGGAPVTWTVTSRRGTYSPPGWDQFTFGRWVPWWFEGGGQFGRSAFAASDICCFPPFPEDEQVETYQGQTDAAGRNAVRMDFSGDLDGEPRVVSANGAVTDVDRQQLAGTADLLVHAGALYVGLRSDQVYVESGQELRVDAIVTDIDGEVATGTEVTMVAERLEWQRVAGEWDEVGVDPETCRTTSADEAVTCAFTLDIGGRYRITATVADGAGGSNRTEITRWVSGAAHRPPTAMVDQESLTLVPDAEIYAAGDTARVLIQAPFDEGTGWVTITRNGFERHRVVELDGGSAVVEVDIVEAMVPGVEVFVEVVGTAPRGTGDDLPPRPAFAVGSVRLDVPPANRTLDVDVTPRDPELLPGGATAVDVVVTDAAGRPVDGAELTLIVVDEAVLSLTGYRLADPLASMYAPLYETVALLAGRASVLLADDEELQGEEPPRGLSDADDGAAGGFATDSAEHAMPGAARTAGGEQATGASLPEQIEIRTDFDALAIFAPEVVTDADGSATVEVPLPDSLTRYRVMAVAAAGEDAFGSGEANITARLPVQVRPSAPRFLNFGDTFELPVVIHNQTDAPVTADVVVEATNLRIDGSGGRRVEVPANERVEVRFPAAADRPGTAQVRAAVVAGPHSDAALVQLPVYTPATAEAFATYGVLDDGAIAQPLLTPEGVFAQFGGLEVSTSSTSLQTLTDALIDLTEYDYGHVDAYASRVLAIVALRDVLGAFAVEDTPTPAELDRRVVADIEAIARLQNPDGGFGMWWRGDESAPFQSLNATHALAAARVAGFDVPDAVLGAALGYVADIEQHLPRDWGDEVRAGLAAYALHVRSVAGDRDQGAADRLFTDRRAHLSVDGLAWLWPIVGAGPAGEIRRELANRVTETPAAATFTTGYGDEAHLVLASDRRTDGIVLDALIRMDPASDLVPKVVNGLLANQRRGSWRNVQENSFILLAMKAYFDAFEAQTPDFVARVWLGDLYAAEAEHRGRSVDTHRTGVPMAELLERDDPRLVLSKTGAGRLYYRIGLRYAPSNLSLAPRDEGFVVERRYEAIDDPGDVRLLSDGRWEVRAGANVRVHLTMVADSQRTNMALIDPTPAGFEILNPDLATAVHVPPEEVDPDDPIPFLRWWGRWFDHQNQRDDRAEAFASWLPAGTYEYSYVARATTPGSFVTPPARAEELYAPEVFGRSATATVVVVDR